MTTTIWHNPRCSKSRATLALLRENGLEPLVRRYLDDPPSEAELRDVLDKLGGTAADILRSGEPRFRALSPRMDAGADALVALMAANPILIERPIVINGDRAAVGRPPEAVLGIL